MEIYVRVNREKCKAGSTEACENPSQSLIRPEDFNLDLCAELTLSA